MENTVHTEIRFERVIKDLDELIEEIQDFGGEYNAIIDSGRAHIDEEAGLRMAEIDFDVRVLENKINEIKEELGLNDKEFSVMENSCITNRWEIYADMKGAKIVSLVGISKGDA